MPSARRLLVALATTALFALGTGSALAAPGHATANVNIRSGPGTNFAKVGMLHKGEQVDIGKCQPGWCQITRQGPDGWVSAKYLSQQNGPMSNPPGQQAQPGGQSNPPGSGGQSNPPPKP